MEKSLEVLETAVLSYLWRWLRLAVAIPRTADCSGFTWHCSGCVYIWDHINTSYTTMIPTTFRKIFTRLRFLDFRWLSLIACPFLSCFLFSIPYTYLCKLKQIFLIKYLI